MNTTTNHETEISASSEVPTITIVREFDAPRELVYRAWTEPELVSQWLGPDGLEMETHTWDCRTGGAYSYTHRDAEGSYDFYGSFHEARAPERLVQTFTFGGWPDAVSLETLTFEELPDGRTRCVATSVLDSFEARDGMLSSGMDVGVKQGYTKLDALLRTLA